MNFYKHHIGDYASHTAHLSWLEDCAYSRLLRLYYRTEKPIATDRKLVCRLIGARASCEKAAIESVLLEFFTLCDDGWHQKRVDEEIQAADILRDSARFNGAKGGRPKGKTSTENKTHSVISENPTGSNPVSGMKPSEKLSRHQTPDAISQIENTRPTVTPTHVARSVDREAVFDHWRQIFGHHSARMDAKRAKVIDAALKLYPAPELCRALDGYKLSPHHSGQNERHTVYDALGLLLRDAEHIDAGLGFLKTAPRQLSRVELVRADLQSKIQNGENHERFTQPPSLDTPGRAVR